MITSLRYGFYEDRLHAHTGFMSLWFSTYLSDKFYLETAFGVDHEVVVGHFEAHQLFAHHRAEWGQDEVAHDLNVVLESCVRVFGQIVAGSEVFGVFAVGLAEEGLVGTSKRFEVDHFDFLFFDSPQTAVHLKVRNMMNIMLQKLTLTNENITNPHHALANIINSSLLIMILKHFNYIEWQYQSLINKAAVILKAERLPINDDLIKGIDQNEVMNVTVDVDGAVLDGEKFVGCVMGGEDVLGASNTAEFVFLVMRGLESVSCDI
jgi:hypothetical protein